MAVKNIVKAIPLTNIASSTFSGSYQAINSTGLPNACFLIRLISTSSTPVTISYDGTNDHDYLPGGATIQLPHQSNSQPNNFIANLPIGTIVYVKGTAGTGNVYLAGYFQPSVN